jgi:PAS domain S-box-containing protein
MASPRLDGSGAIADAEFHPYFQPLVDLRTSRLQGFELLARWHHPQQGWIEPETFIPRAEQDGWIDSLTWSLLRKAFSAATMLPDALTLAVNISPLQLRNLNLPKQIQQLAQASGFMLDRLTIEITESALAENVVYARTIAHDLKAMGCKLALDDFGTGYSSLSHLQSLPFDELKVDRSFVGSMAHKRDSRKIVAAVVGLGQSLGLTTVAEGVETQEQAEMLLWLGCELGQGWLYGRPVPARELEAVLSAPPQVLPSTLSREGKDEPVSRRSLDNLPAQRLAQLQAVYDGAPVGLAFLDCNLRYMNLNRRLADMNGRPMEEHLGRTVREMIPELFPRVEPFIRRALGGESILSVEVTKPPSGANPGATIVLSYEPARDEGGEVVGVSVALVDVTSLKRAEEARRETEEHFRHLMELLPQIPWIIDPEGRAIDVSQRWLEITGMTGDQWKGFGWLDALHPDDRTPTLAAMHRSFGSGQPIDVEYRVRRPGCEWKRLRSRGAARRGADGRIICWYGGLEILDEDT